MRGSSASATLGLTAVYSRHYTTVQRTNKHKIGLLNRFTKGRQGLAPPEGILVLSGASVG
jgi:hypothetical protein